jgi:hypothetical protein
MYMYRVPYRCDPLGHARKPQQVTAGVVKSTQKRLTRQTRSIYDVSMDEVLIGPNYYLNAVIASI